MRIVARSLGVLMVAVLTACCDGGGGGSSSNSGESNNISGRTTRGVIANADVIASL